jgi:16S rRNA (guanine527-N7)-methyltransferase
MFHVKHEAWAQDAARLGVPLSSEQLDQLAAYEELLRRTAVPRGMIAASDEGKLWERHIADGLRGAPVVPGGAAIADLGSGAGIPGIPLAVALRDSAVVLVEARRRRAAFLEAVVDDLSLSNVKVFPHRSEDGPGSFQVCVARAFSSPLSTWLAAQPLLAPGGLVIYWAGQRFQPRELDEAAVPWMVSTRSDLARSGPLVIMGPQ